MPVTEITDDNYSKEVEDHDGVVVIDFWAEWCIPCRTMMPIIEQLSSQYEGKVKILKANVDDNSKAVRRFAVGSIPAFFVLKNGQVLSQHSGTAKSEELQKMIDEAVNSDEGS